MLVTLVDRSLFIAWTFISSYRMRECYSEGIRADHRPYPYHSLAVRLLLCEKAPASGQQADRDQQHHRPGKSDEDAPDAEARRAR